MFYVLLSASCLSPIRDAAPAASPLPAPTETIAPVPSIVEGSPTPIAAAPTTAPTPGFQYPANDIILDMAYSPDAAILAVASGLNIRLYDAATLQERAHIPFTVWVNRLAFHPMLPILATAAKDGRVQFWDTTTGTEICAFSAHEKGAIAVDFHPSLPILGTTGNAIISKVWDISSVLSGGCDVTEAGQLIGASYNATDFLFSPDGLFFALTDIESIRLRNPADLTLINTLRTGLPIYDLALSPNSRWLAAANRFSQVTLFDLSDPKNPVRAVLGEATPKTFTWRVAFSPDSALLAAGNSRGALTVWDVRTLQPVASFRLPNDVAALTFSPDTLSGTGKRWLLAGGTDAAIHFFDLETLP